MIRNLDPEGNEYITEVEFRKMMRGKNDVPEEDVEEMIEEYKSVNTESEDLSYFTKVWPLFI